MTTPRRREGVLSTMADDDMLLLDRHRGLIHRLNHTAGFIWSRCDGATGLSDVAAEMAQVFEVDAASAARDVTAVVEQLTAVGVLEQLGADGDVDLLEGSRREEQS